jgi:PAS domain S-box-containing protein
MSTGTATTVTLSADECIRATIELLRIINATTTKQQLIHEVTVLLKQLLKCDAIGIRLKEGEDYPYFETAGFPEKFVRAERHLCSYNKKREVVRDEAGNPVLDCMCGNIISKRFDPARSFFTPHGSFWSNGTTQLLASTSDEDRQARTRNRCNGEGYESVGLFPLRLGDDTFGLVQVNNKREGLFDADIIAFLEQFADNLSIRLAHLRTEEALTVSEERYRLIVENCGDAILFTEPGGEIYSANPEACRILGRTEDEIKRVGRGGILDLLDERLPGALIERRRTGYFKGEINFVRANGTSFPADITTRIFKDSQGHERTTIILRDIGERKRTEEALIESERFARSTLDGLLANIAIVNDAGVIEAVNKAWKDFAITNDMGWDKVSEGSNYLTVCRRASGKDAEGAVEFADEVENVLSGRKELYEMEYPCHSAVEKRWFNVRVTRFPGEGRRRVVIAHENITTRKLAEDNLRSMETWLRQSEKMDAIGQLAGGIAHDFNNVLGGIIGYTDISLGYAEKGSMLEKNLLKVLTASDRAKNLVKQILTFSRQGNPQKSAIYIRPIIKEVLDLLRASIPSSVVIEADLKQDTKAVLADPTKIHEVLLNLASNAVYAMNRKGTLSIRLYEEKIDHVLASRTGEILPGEYKIIEIADTGSGMDEAVLSKAFDPFFTTKGIGEGTGMGLSVVLGVVKSHDGNIQVESTVGKGTTFTVYFPATTDAVSRTGDDEPRSQLRGRERILFVDDEHMLVDMALSMLVPLGYTLTALASSVEALAYFREHAEEIDLLITDQTMPGMTGIELAQEIQGMKKELPIILCTGFSNEINTAVAMDVGVKQIVMKPYGYHEISKAIREVMDNRPAVSSDHR